ncbi:hypothetical protein OJ997_11165 [Solirubrobacter phytolaccae]|uniref:Uncharacterized protein n=1 Tax=Solirubrobacter phytolaccae TaxID=1404360 RepID=A0A9X3N776_9ACTN|nr:hypothetical protein [Solirubrobacter phytolaccae]MDA0180854.1 hypothetical protein [Solirubrobacter phytolaccae]
MLVRLAAVAVLLTALLAAPAQAAVTATVAVSGSRLVVTVKGTKAKAVTLVVAGKRHTLSKSGSKWRTKVLTPVPSIAGTTVKVKVRPARGATKTISVKVPAAPTPPAPAPTAPPATAPAPTPAAPTTLFPPPAAATTGNQAFEEIKTYLADSRFTDCPASWPNCAVEERYSHFADGSHYYCRLTPTSGSDIRSVGEISQISGAEHGADGSWGVEYYLSSYGNTVFYSWSVSNQGVAYGRYWGPGRSPQSGPPNQQFGPLQWVRGAKDCSY